MKQILLVALLVLCANVAFGQDIIRTNDGKEIKAAIQEIGEETVVYKVWSDLDGPVFRIDKDKVVKITLQSGAEYYFSDLYKKIERGEDVPKSIYYSGGDLYNGESKIKLTKEEVKTLLTEEQYNKYLSADNLRKTKNGLLISGLVLLPIGVAGTILGLHGNVLSNGYDYTAISIVGTAVAGTLIFASIPIAIISSSKANSVVRNYNEARGYLSVGVTSSGFGLAYNF